MKKRNRKKEKLSLKQSEYLRKRVSLCNNGKGTTAAINLRWRYKHQIRSLQKKGYLNETKEFTQKSVAFLSQFFDKYELRFWLPSMGDYVTN